ncbi:MAG: purine-nucleoside phosphorylase [Anaerolineales bacterium]
MEYLMESDINEATQAIRDRTKVEPKIGMILGSGLGNLAESVENKQAFSSKEIPGWPASTVEGHEGRLVFGELEEKPVFVMQGRAHYYEGHPIARIGLPVRVMQTMGVEIIIITNAAGAVHPDFSPGELMLIVDHINILGMAGITPLYGPNLDRFGPRFPDMSRAYDLDLLNSAREAAREGKIPVQEGVYVCLAGPSFETPADLRFLRGIGVDAVGMSTVPEVIVARHGGTRVLGISGISNKANLDGKTETTHEEVLEAGEILVPRLIDLLTRVLRKV